MRLTEQIDIEAVSVVAFGCKPRKALKRIQVSTKRRSKKITVPKTGKIALRVHTPLTRPLAELLGVDSLLFEGERNVPRDGYKRITLDVDYFSNIHVQVKNQNPDTVLDVIADRLERWMVVEEKGVGPMMQWDVRTTGYVSQLADFVSLIDDKNFVMKCSPAQGTLGFDKPSKDKDQPKVPEIYRTN